MINRNRNTNIASLALVSAVAGLLLASASVLTIQPAFAHARTTLTLEDDDVEGKQIRVTLGHSSEPAYGAKAGIHDGRHDIEVELADSETLLPLSGAQLQVDKYYFKDLKAFSKAKTLSKATEVVKEVELDEVFGEAGHYVARQVQKDGIYGYRLYGIIDYFDVAIIDIDTVVFCTSEHGTTTKFNSEGWSGSFGCTEDIEDTLFPEDNDDARMSTSKASLELNTESGFQVQQAGLEDAPATTPTVAVGNAASPVQQPTSSTIGLQLLAFGLPTTALASFIGLRLYRQHKQDKSL